MWSLFARTKISHRNILSNSFSAANTNYSVEILEVFGAVFNVREHVFSANILHYLLLLFNGNSRYKPEETSDKSIAVADVYEVGMINNNKDEKKIYFIT